MSEAQKGRKRVRLVQEPEVNVFDEHEMSETDRDRIWWRQEDFEEAKASVKRMCRGLRKERRFSGCLTDAYERACCMTSTCSGSLEAMPENHWEALRTNKDLTTLFADQGPRGLERLSSRLHAMRRQRHLQEIKHAVFLEQARQQIANQRDSELLGRQAEFASRKARAFAHLLGQADAWAVTHDSLPSTGGTLEENEAGPPSPVAVSSDEEVEVEANAASLDNPGI